MEPFYTVARSLYEGPWVAERYSAVKALIESNPGALHPVTRAITEGARKFDAVATFEALYRLAGMKRATEGVWRDFDAMALPTMPRFYTRAEVEADPIRLNSNLGTYTNFVNLLDLAAIAAPSGVRSDGLPSSITLVGPAGSDGMLAAFAAAMHAASGAPIGATGLMPPPAPRMEPSSERIEIAAVGAHLSGLPLNRELTEIGGTLVREARTTADYRLYALPGTVPPKPGLLRVAPGAGAAIAVEVWSLEPAAFGGFVARIPPPLGVGTIAFEDGSSAKGFIVEAQAVAGAEDISRFGGWRAFVAARNKGG
jgi:allophanate hydrolase